MATIIVPTPKRARKMYWVASNGKSGEMYRAPSGFEFSNVYNSAQVEREGLKPLTPFTSPGLKQLSFTQVIAKTDYAASVEGMVKELAASAANGSRVRFSGGSAAFENGTWWVVTGLSVKATRRASDNSGSFMKLEWQLIEYVGNGTTTTASSSGKKSTGAVRYHTTKKGESLYIIAKRYLGKGERWKEIWNLNKKLIPNPDRLKAGVRIKIPGK